MNKETLTEIRRLRRKAEQEANIDPGLADRVANKLIEQKIAQYK